MPAGQSAVSLRVLDVEGDPFELDLRVDPGLECDGPAPCGTDDGCAATCASSCNSGELTG